MNVWRTLLPYFLVHMRISIFLLSGATHGRTTVKHFTVLLYLLIQLMQVRGSVTGQVTDEERRATAEAFRLGGQYSVVKRFFSVAGDAQYNCQ